MHQTLAEAGEAVVELIEHEATKAPEEEPNINLSGIEEVVADKGYHSGAVVQDLHAVGCRSYIPERTGAGVTGMGKRKSRSRCTPIGGGFGGRAASDCSASAVN